jgi:hypothetical protein
MTKPLITGVNTLAPMFIQKYERYLPTAFDESPSLLQKVNKVIVYLNQIGEITNDVVEQWNTVMQWIVDGGITDTINDKIDALILSGELDQMLLNAITDVNDLVAALQAVDVEHDGKITAVSNAVKKIALDVNDFGADPTGATFSDTAFKNAITEASSKGVPLMYSGTFKFQGEIKIPSNLELYGSYGSILDGSALPQGTTYGISRLFSILGDKGVGTPLSVNLSQFARTVVVGDGTLFVPGDLVYIESTDKYDSSSNSTINKADVLKVKSVSGNTLTLDGSTFFDYTTSTTRVYKVTTVKNVRFHNVNIVMGGVGKAHTGIRIEYAENIVFENSSIKNAEDTGIQMERSYDIKINHNHISGCTSPSGYTSGYGVSVSSACRSVLVKDNIFRNNRHSVTGGGTAGGFTTIESNFCYGDSDNSLDCHEPVFYWSFKNNKINGSLGGIIARGQHITIEGNEVVDVSQNGIYVRAFSLTIDKALDYVISNNKVHGALNGITIDGAQGLVKNAVVSNNSIHKASGEGLFIANAESVTISNNTVYDTNRCARITNIDNVSLNGNTFDKLISNNTIGDLVSIYNAGKVAVNGNSFKNGANQLKLEYIKDVATIVGNTFDSGGIYGVLVDTTGKNTVINSNVFTGFTFAASRAIRTVSANNIICNGNLALGTTGSTDDAYFSDATNVVAIGNIWKGSFTSNITNFQAANNVVI